MAKKGGKKGGASKKEKGPKQKKEKKPLHKLYEKKGEGLERLAKHCPKCGTGFFMAKHANRETCGKCKYTVFA